VSFLALNVAVLLFSELALGKRFPNYNNKKHFTEFENPLLEDEQFQVYFGFVL
jgi:hypothetical protein